MKRKLHTYEAAEVIVEYDAARCIHAKACVQSLPTVSIPRADHGWLRIRLRPMPSPTSCAGVRQVRCTTALEPAGRSNRRRGTKPRPSPTDLCICGDTSRCGCQTVKTSQTHGSRSAGAAPRRTNPFATTHTPTGSAIRPPTFRRDSQRAMATTERFESASRRTDRCWSTGQWSSAAPMAVKRLARAGRSAAAAGLRPSRSATAVTLRPASKQTSCLARSRGWPASPGL